MRKRAAVSVEVTPADGGASGGGDGGSATQDGSSGEGGSSGGGTTSCAVAASAPGPPLADPSGRRLEFGRYEVLVVPRIAHTGTGFEITTASNGTGCKLRRDQSELVNVPCTGKTVLRGDVLGAGSFDLELAVTGGPSGGAACKAHVTVGYPRPCTRGTIQTTHTGYRAVLQTISPALSRTFTYDAGGLLKTSKLTAGAADQTTTLSYDASSRPSTELVVEQNRLLTYTYRSDGQVGLVTDDIAQDGVDFRFTYEIDGSGRLTSVLEENLIDSEARRHTFGYDAAGLVTSRAVTVVRGNPPTASATYAHDAAAGNIVSETNPANATTRAYTYACFP